MIKFFQRPGYHFDAKNGSGGYVFISEQALINDDIRDLLQELRQLHYQLVNQRVLYRNMMICSKGTND